MKKGPETKQIIRQLIKVGSRRIPHRYDGRCPDPLTEYQARDPNCLACQVLIEAENLLSFLQTK